MFCDDPGFPDPRRLDPGIRELVLHLRGLGYVTTDSGDGVSKPPVGRVLDIPHVFIRRDDPGDLREEAHQLARHLEDFGCGARRGLRARFVQLGLIVGLGCICITFGAMLADLLMRGETGAVILASSVLAGVAWVVYNEMDRAGGGR